MKRPGGVTAIAVLSFVMAALNLAGAVLSEGPRFGANDETTPSFAVTVVWIFLRVGASAWNGANGVGLLRLENWARRSTIALVICVIAVAFLGALRAVLSQEFVFAIVEVGMVAMGVWIATFLSQPRVKAQFALPRG